MSQACQAPTTVPIKATTKECGRLKPNAASKLGVIASIVLAVVVLFGGCHQNRFKTAQWRDDYEKASQGALLPGTSLNGTSLPGTSLPGTSLPGTSLPGTSLPGTRLPGTSLPGY